MRNLPVCVPNLFHNRSSLVASARTVRRIEDAYSQTSEHLDADLQNLPLPNASSPKLWLPLWRRAITASARRWTGASAYPA